MSGGEIPTQQPSLKQDSDSLSPTGEVIDTVRNYLNFDTDHSSYHFGLISTVKNERGTDSSQSWDGLGFFGTSNTFTAIPGFSLVDDFILIRKTISASRNGDGVPVIEVRISKESVGKTLQIGEKAGEGKRASGNPYKGAGRETNVLEEKVFQYTGELPKIKK